MPAMSNFRIREGEKEGQANLAQELCGFCRKVRRLLQPRAYANLHWGLLFIRLETEPHNSYVKESGHGCENGMQQFIGRTLTTTSIALIRAVIKVEPH